MDIAFIEEKDKFVVTYLDDITMLSQSDKEHCDHLKRVFLKCRIFGLSPNPKKIISLIGNLLENQEIEGAQRLEIHLS